MILRMLIQRDEQGVLGILYLAREIGDVSTLEGLHMQLGGLHRIDHHQIVHQDSRNLDEVVVDAFALGQAHDLTDDDAAAVLDSHGLSQGLRASHLLFHEDVAGLIGGGAANESHVGFKGLVGQIGLAVKLDAVRIPRWCGR